jgi:hypothetical protein
MGARLPHNLTREHILKTIKGIDARQIVVPPTRRSRKFVVRRGKSEYPPKYLICRAHVFLADAEWPNIFGGGPEANNFLIARDFEIWDVSKHPAQRVGLLAEFEDDESAFPEGRALYRLHKSLERDTRLAKALKDRVLGRGNELTCQVCGFSFRKKYGNVGVGFIECHHTIPVSELRGRRKTKIEEIAMVCSNCHRMLHRYRPWLSVEQLRQRLDPVDA